MAINLATKFASATSDVLKATRKSKEFTNQNWNWDGVNSVSVYTLTSPTMNTYDPLLAANRYGALTEVQDTIQTFTLLRDRSWTKTIDKKNYQDTMMIRKPGAYLAQATREVLVPEMDAYIFSTINTAAGVTRATVAATPAVGSLSADSGVLSGATTTGNAYSNFLALNADITNKEGVESGRIAAMTAQYYNLLKQGGFVLNSDLAYKDRKSGDLGEVDGVRVVIVPSNRLPVAVDLIIAHADVTCAPEKLVDYTLHNNAPGISGDLLEYRHRYDAFIDINKLQNIAIHKTA